MLALPYNILTSFIFDKDSKVKNDIFLFVYSFEFDAIFIFNFNFSLFYSDTSL